jgi:hypothetical protein
MFRRIRYRNWLVAGLGLAALVVPTTALAGNSYRDGWYGYAVSSTKAQQSQVVDGRSPDTRDAALAAQPKLDPAIVKYLLRYGFTQSQIAAMSGGAFKAQPTLVDGRSPDTVDFAVQAHSPVVTVTRDPGFQWGDFGIGLSAAILALALLGIMRLFSNRGEHKPVTSS